MGARRSAGRMELKGRLFFSDRFMPVMPPHLFETEKVKRAHILRISSAVSIGSEV